MTTSEQDTTTYHTIEANGIDIHYLDYGAGEPLILVHGGVVTAESWKRYSAGFAERYRVIAPDTRGHGRTNNPSGDMSFQLLADDVAAFISALGLEKPLVCGYSDGGQTVLELGMRYPDLPRALIIAGAYTELPEASKQWVQSALGEIDLPVDFERFEQENPEWVADLKETHGDPQWKTLIQNIKPMWNATLNYTAEDFAKVTAPALVLLADHDDLVPVEDAFRMYRLLPHAELAIVPQSNHHALIVSPSKVALAQALMLDFLARHSGSEGENA